ncbi:GIY-YIG nuclease family protein [Microbacterium sp. AZCO]|uniref:GIY-YIG nuclease family protein n=1 Tax=Microbacterium sp. AZCO TaxID=3142976 RepID=UPI0031F3B7B8
MSFDRDHCLVADGCRGPVPPDAPLPLCERHLAVAADWAASAFGLTDTLPAPCRLCGSRLGIQYPSGWLCATCEWRFGEVVDGELPPPRVDVVYYLAYADRVKIGTTANPRRRFTAIWHDDLLALERGDRRLERHRHEQFAADRFGTSEWFARSPALDAHIEAVRGGGEPWDAYARWVSEAVALQS